MTDKIVAAKPAAPVLTLAGYLRDLAGKRMTKLTLNTTVSSGGKVIIAVAPFGDEGSAVMFEVGEEAVTLVP